ncbi:MAG: hypothetical protein ACMUIP_17350 [bacterium]
MEGYSTNDPLPIKNGLYVGHWTSWVIDEYSHTREKIGGQIEIELYEDPTTERQWLGEMTVSGWDFFEGMVFDVRANAYLNTGSNRYTVNILAEFAEDQFWLITSSELNPMNNTINGNFNLINKYDISPQGGLVEDLTYIN